MRALSMCMGRNPLAHMIPHFTKCSNYTNGKCEQRYPFLDNITHHRNKIAGSLGHLVEVQQW